ncbi:DUF4347 domain-containing protein [Lyngbya aestuarii]|uniref:DUF4347 domain-containing protein n=1 Tax=Lyngbya aestuarii TaxID=118322 RepID=UPI00403E333A
MTTSTLYRSHKTTPETSFTQDEQLQENALMLVVIDPRVDNYQMLAAGVLPGAKVLVLDTKRDGIEQITEELANHPLATLHIVCHGSPGALLLGNTLFSLENLDSYASDLQTWSIFLGRAPLLLYGCNVAAGETGATFLARLHELVGTNIAASANYTGSADQGGDWELEVTTGKIEAPLAFQAAVREAYDSVLPINLTGLTAPLIEGGDSGLLTVGLDLGVPLNLGLLNPPPATATITLTPDNQLNLGQGAGQPVTVDVTINNGASISTSQNIQVLAVNDGVDEGGLHNGSITASVSTSNATLQGVLNLLNLGVTLPVPISDPLPLPEVSITPADGILAVTEGGATDTLQVALTGLPLAPVTLSVTSDNPEIDLGAGVGNPITLDFDPTNGTTPQLVNISVADDGIVEGLQTGNLTITADVAGLVDLSLPPLTVNITDAIVPGLPSISIVPTDGLLAVTEGGDPATLEVSLTDLPLAPVTLSVTSDNPEIDLGAGVGNPITLDFDPTNGTTPQLVNISVADDGIVEGLQTGNLTITADVAGLVDLSLPPLTVNITDAIVPGLPSISIVPTDGLLAVTEGGDPATLEVSLTDLPLAPVTLSVTSDNPEIDLGAGVGNPITLDFDPTNGTTPQLVNISVADDGIVEGLQTGNLTITADVAGLVDLSLPPLTVNITDAIVPGLPSISIVPTDGLLAVTEGGDPATLEVSLTDLPLAPVTLSVTSDNPEIDLGAGVGNPVTLSFDPANPTAPQTLNVSIADNGQPDGDRTSNLTITADTAGLVNLDFSPISIAITDAALPPLPLPGVSILPADGILAVTEGGATDTLQVSLTGLPAVPVTLTVTSDNPELDLGAGVGNPIILNFDPTNGTTPQLVNISVADDGIVEGSQTGNLTITADVEGLVDLNLPPLTVDITDAVVPETPVPETPVTETPVTETPVTETPVPETPVPETPVPETPDTSSPISRALIQGVNDFFTVQGPAGENVVLEFDLSSVNTDSLNEIGVFVVDDAAGNINGVSPGTPGYLTEALARVQQIFSVLPDTNDLLPNSNLLRNISFPSGTQLGLYLVQDGTATEALSELAAGRTPPNVFFGSPSSNTNGIDYLQASELADGNFTLAWQDQLGGSNPNFDNVILGARATTDTALPVGTQQQQDTQLEVIDLRDQVGQLFDFNFVGASEADYDNSIGLYVIEDLQGTIIDQLTGALFTPGNEGYAQVAIRQAVFASELESNQNTNGSQQLIGGLLYAPYVISNGSKDEFLANDSFSIGDAEDPQAYFAYQQANQDGIDHIRLLGNNTFAFEDMFGGGDGDFNDAIFQGNLT